MITAESFHNIAAGFESLATILSLAVGGWWVYRIYVSQQDAFAHVESSAAINFLGEQDDQRLIELTTTLQNKGKVQQKISEFGFDLEALSRGDKVSRCEQYGGQAHFPHSIQVGSFLPKRSSYFFIGPGVTAKYSFVACVPKETTFLMLHSFFKYHDRPGLSQTAECTVQCPLT